MSVIGCECEPKFDGLSADYKRALWIVVVMNGLMFVIELASGAFAGSKALQADALDFLGDTATYGLSLYVIGMSLKARANAALIKGVSLSIMGAWVLGTTVYQVFVSAMPKAEVMGIIGLLALLVNMGSVLLLTRYKDGDANVRSVWLCSRNDAIGNIAVMIAAGAVWFTKTPWPDLIVTMFIGGLFFWSSIQIIRQALNERRQPQS